MADPVSPTPDTPPSPHGGQEDSSQQHYLPLAELGPALTHEQQARYHRNIVLPGIGEEGQRRLCAGRVLVIGAGGLGSPVLLYLAAAGVGIIGIVDDDTVDVTNLQRQVIHSTASVGELKVQSACRHLQDLNPSITVTPFPFRLTPERWEEIIASGPWDLVIDATDNFETRYLIDTLSESSGLPHIMGAVFHWQGQVTTLWGACPDPQRAVTLTDLYPIPAAEDAQVRMPQPGIMGALCCTIGGLMATEAVKLLTGAGEPLLGRLLVYDSERMTTKEIRLLPSSNPTTSSSSP